VRGDHVGHAGELVEHVAQRVEVFHRPAQAVRQQGAERVERDRHRLDRQGTAGQQVVDPAFAADRGGQALDAVRQRHAGQRAAGGDDRRDQGVAHRGGPARPIASATEPSTRS
jgi:hypothetical protein